MHAGVVIADHDRETLERLCRYGTSPAFGHERLAWTSNGQIAYRLKRPWPDGRTELVLPPLAFLRRLCGIIPPSRRHLVRYTGVFGPASKRRAPLRALMPVPAGEPPPSAATPSGSTRAGRVPWAELLRRVFRPVNTDRSGTDCCRCADHRVQLRCTAAAPSTWLAPLAGITLALTVTEAQTTA